MKFLATSSILLSTLTLTHAIPAAIAFPQATPEVDCYQDFCHSFERSTATCDIPWMKGEFTKDQFIECLCTKEREDEYQKCYTCTKEHDKKEYQTLYTYQCSEEFKSKDDTTDKKDSTTKGNDAGVLYLNKGMAGLTIVVGGLIATL